MRLGESSDRDRGLISLKEIGKEEMSQAIE